MELTSRPRQVYQVFIRATPERVWDAIAYGETGGPTTHAGTVLEVDPPRRLVHTFAFTAAGDPEAADDPPSRVTWEIEARGAGTCRLTLVHDEFTAETKT